MTTYPAYLNGLTIEHREGNWCVTNDFGGRIVHKCDGLDDALDMRQRASIGVPANVVELVAGMDATRNAIYAVTQAIVAETGEAPFRFFPQNPHLIRYGVLTDDAMFWGEDYDSHVVALERLLDSVREVSEYQMEAAQ